MALSGNLDITGTHGFVDRRLATSTQNGGMTTDFETESNNYSTIFDLDTRLQALDATTYTKTYLQMLSKNDKIYALRTLTADAAGI